MIDLNIDTSSLSAEFQLSQNDVDGLLQYVVEEVSAQFAAKWDNEAKTTLKQAKDEYRRSIQVVKRGRFTSIVYLNPASWLPNAIEMGFNAFDMKTGFMKSSKVKYSSNGQPYLTIPFRFATPGSLGESSAFSGVMPVQIQTAVRQNETANPNQQSRSGLPLSNIPTKFQIPKSITLRRQMKSGNFANINKDTPMTSIYQGLKRNSDGAGYVMFRRVSLNTDADRWQHPGFQAKDLAQKALNRLDVPRIVDITTDNYLSQLGF